MGGIAYFAVSGLDPGIVSYALGGYTVLMVLVQVRLVPVYAWLSFGPGFWAFTFAYASTATYALDWLDLKRPPGHTVYADIVLALITGFVGVIAVRSLILLGRGAVLPARAG